ncbi:hypothetical protein BDN72DRAFT_901510 [Pluteus cervinus]|uniref:Uncharacterized protein n=1 Tax=Pluteus cervinus TaxID=181527 RepID=A0ACD3AGJ1_9AGAR|nr:hypothetical protein BDN72DRAFT_901510 [Pluteus cervinus]
MPDPESEEIQPAFPPEIEELIFSLSAQSDLESSKILIFVAKRVYEWLKPHLYKVAILHDNQADCGRLELDSKLLKIHGHHVRHLLLWYRPWDEMFVHNPATFLSWCPNVVDIALWRVETVYDGDLVDQLLALPLTRISFDVTRLNDDITKYSISKPISFTSVTHLELNGMEIRFPVDKIKGYFPSITHMALEEDLKLPVKDILDCWGDQLEVLIWYHGTKSVSDDPRVVVLSPSGEYVRNWNEATKDGPSSVWRKAEEEVKRRRRDAGM